MFAKNDGLYTKSPSIILFEASPNELWAHFSPLQLQNDELFLKNDECLLRMMDCILRVIDFVRNRYILWRDEKAAVRGRVRDG